MTTDQHFVEAARTNALMRRLLASILRRRGRVAPRHRQRFDRVVWRVRALLESHSDLVARLEVAE